MQKDTSWDNVADWYHDLLGGEDTYQKEVILPNIIRLAGIKKGDTVLDIACGEGFFSRIFQKEGATVTGIDLSPKLIDLAKKHGEAIHYEVASADKIPSISSDTIDSAFCILALQNIENVNGVFDEVFRVLKAGGRFIFVLNHPAFRIPKKSFWQFDEKKDTQYRRIDAYLSESKTTIDMHPGDKAGEKTVSFHRSIQAYFKSLTNRGFAVTRLEEWVSHKKSEKGPRAIAEDRARKEIPLFLCIEARKAKIT